MILGLVGGVSRVCRRRVCCFFFSLLWLGRKGSAVAAAAASARGFLVFPNRSQNNMRKYTIICVCMYKPAKGLIVNFKMFFFCFFLLCAYTHTHMRRFYYTEFVTNGLYKTTCPFVGTYNMYVYIRKLLSLL